MKLQLKALKEPQSKTTGTDTDADYTDGGKAPQRVMFINLWFFKYGTNDKAHGASIVLALVLLILIASVYFFGGGPDELKDKLISWAGSAFLFVAGVAVGKSGNGEEQ